MTAFMSCDDKPVTADKLPAKAKTFLNTYFPGIAISSSALANCRLIVMVSSSSS